jgi:hypothetical protein
MGERYYYYYYYYNFYSNHPFVRSRCVYPGGGGSMARIHDLLANNGV